MKKSKDTAGIIYSVENEITGEYYIGATTTSLEDRRADHLRKSVKDSKLYFHESIATYGIEAFVWNEIDTANSVDELAQKEKEYIKHYNSKEEGYNCDSGGGFKKTVYQYDLESGELIKSYNSLESASSAINATKQQLSRACLSVNKTFGGFYWSYEFDEPFIPEKDLRCKQVIQLSLEDEEITNFRSASEASRKTGISKSSITKVCRGERDVSGGYKWKYK